MFQVNDWVSLDQFSNSLMTKKSGGWEEHTRGVGSRLMLAMGWQTGSGLGKAGGGRVDPVEARIYPQVF